MSRKPKTQPLELLLMRAIAVFYRLAGDRWARIDAAAQAKYFQERLDACRKGTRGRKRK